jgi:hypothetical protein
MIPIREKSAIVQLCRLRRNRRTPLILSELGVFFDISVKFRTEISEKTRGILNIQYPPSFLLDHFFTTLKTEVIIKRIPFAPLKD